MPGSQEHRMATDYVITVKGHLDAHWSAWFEGLTITNGANGEATLAGPVVDQAALHGLLIKIRDLGLPLIAVVRGSKPESDETGKSST
jgi:hypothetical protein